MNITIYTKAQCPNCVSAKALLKSKGLEYTEIESMPEILEMLRHYPDARQMPQIFINGQRVGGFAGLQAALNWPEEALKQVGL
jgi:glutaredoxin 3